MDTIGQTLKKARESRKMTVPEVAHATKARIQYIEAIEADDFSVFPAPIYAQGFIRLYAECVGINPQPLLQASRGRGAEPPAAGKARSSAKAPVNKTSLADQFSENKTRAADPADVAVDAASRRGATLWPAALKKIRWSEFEDRCVALSAIRLPVETWKNILAVAGMLLLALAAVAALAGYLSWKNGAATASRWLAEPPAPYLSAE